MSNNPNYHFNNFSHAIWDQATKRNHLSLCLQCQLSMRWTMDSNSRKKCIDFATLKSTKDRKSALSLYPDGLWSANVHLTHIQYSMCWLTPFLSQYMQCVHLSQCLQRVCVRERQEREYVWMWCGTESKKHFILSEHVRFLLSRCEMQSSRVQAPTLCCFCTRTDE